MEERDIPAIREIYDAAGYDFPSFDSPLIEAVDVVVDDSDVPFMAAAAKRGIEVILFCAPKGATHPQVKLEGIRLLHESMRDKIVPKGYDEAYSFLPPEIVKSHGRHLQRIFGWVPCWKAYLIRNWRG
jgi:hypothetical protein